MTAAAKPLAGYFVRVFEDLKEQAFQSEYVESVARSAVFLVRSNICIPSFNAARICPCIHIYDYFLRHGRALDKKPVSLQTL